MSRCPGVRPGSWGWWGLVVVYVFGLLAVQPFLGFAVDAFKARWGEAALERTVWVAAALAAAAVLAGLAWFWGAARPLERVLVIAGLALYAVGVAVLEIPQERLHYVEYGMLSGLVYAGLQAREGRGRARAAAVAFLVAAGLGTVDEVLQGRLWERRYFDWRDVALNARAAALGILLAMPMLRVWQRRA